jgi:hypothetical protein
VLVEIREQFTDLVHSEDSCKVLDHQTNTPPPRGRDEGPEAWGGKNISVLLHVEINETPTIHISAVGGLFFDACFSQLEPKPPSGGGQTKTETYVKIFRSW